MARSNVIPDPVWYMGEEYETLEAALEAMKAAYYKVNDLNATFHLATASRLLMETQPFHRATNRKSITLLTDGTTAARVKPSVAGVLDHDQRTALARATELRLLEKRGTAEQRVSKGKYIYGSKVVTLSQISKIYRGKMRDAGLPGYKFMSDRYIARLIKQDAEATPPLGD